MTELEALAKDRIENHTHKLVDKPTKQDIYTREESIYISGYKECERQNKNKIADFEAKIVKMQCCENCKRYKPYITCNKTIGNNCDYYSGVNVCNNWKLN